MKRKDFFKTLVLAIAGVVGYKSKETDMIQRCRENINYFADRVLDIEPPIACEAGDIINTIYVFDLETGKQRISSICIIKENGDRIYGKQREA